VLPRCGHSFHEACIDAWLWTSPTCPSCRVVIFAESPSLAPADEVVEDTVANGGVVA
jgi:E3 ubiquitin-protein ligase ATL4